MIEGITLVVMILAIAGFVASLRMRRRLKRGEIDPETLQDVGRDNDTA